MVTVDYYSVLGLNSSAKKDDIERAYKKLSLKYHPDRPNGNADKFRKIQEAYDYLSTNNNNFQKSYFTNNDNYFYESEEKALKTILLPKKVNVFVPYSEKAPYTATIRGYCMECHIRNLWGRPNEYMHVRKIHCNCTPTGRINFDLVIDDLSKFYIDINKNGISRINIKRAIS